MNKKSPKLLPGWHKAIYHLLSGVFLSYFNSSSPKWSHVFLMMHCQTFSMVLGNCKKKRNNFTWKLFDETLEMESKISTLPELINIMFPPDIPHYPLAQGWKLGHTHMSSSWWTSMLDLTTSPRYRVPNRWKNCCRNIVELLHSDL